jgi:hypothetical protein
MQADKVTLLVVVGLVIVWTIFAAAVVITVY